MREQNLCHLSAKNNMQVALITPSAFLNTFASKSKYHLVLAHIYEICDTYRNWYKERVTAGDFVVLDNSAYELGGSVSVQRLLKCAQDLNPTAVFLPDVRFDALETIRLTETSLKTFENLACQKWAVPQGRNLVEIIGSYTTLKNLGVDGFGLYEEIGEVAGLDSRREFLKYLESQFLVDPTKKYHLLGMEEDLTHLKDLSNFGWVSGIDSVKLIVYGLNGMKIDELAIGDKYPHRPKGYFEIEEISEEKIQIINHNIHIGRSWARDF